MFYELLQNRSVCNISNGHKSGGKTFIYETFLTVMG